MTDAVWTSEMRKGVAELCVLAALRERGGYGYQIAQSMRSFSSLGMKDSTLYLILSRLERDKLVEIELMASDRGPKRRYFTLTDIGISRLADMASFWNDFSKDVTDFLSVTNEGLGS